MNLRNYLDSTAGSAERLSEDEISIGTGTVQGDPLSRPAPPICQAHDKKNISAKAEIPNYQFRFDSLGFLFLCIEAVWMFIVCQCVLCQTFLNILPYGLIFVNLRDIYSLFRAYMLFDYFPPCQEMFWSYRISAYRL